MAKRIFIIIILPAIAVAGYYGLISDTRPDPAADLIAFIGPQNDYSRWHKIKKKKKLNGVALVVHGLNLKPERMQNVIAELNTAGIEVLNIALTGHGNNYQANPDLSIDQARLESFQTVTYQTWLAELYAAYRKVRQRAEQRKVPVYFIGYSLGAVMGCDLALCKPDVQYDKMILFAPALSVTEEAHFLKALLQFPNVVIDSLSPSYYRSNAGTPMAAYKALFEAIDDFNRRAKDKINLPTIIFIDEEDEMVPYEKLAGLIRHCHLDAWRIVTVSKDDDVPSGVAHHLIIDPDSVGRCMWNDMAAAIKAHTESKR